jgi:transposase-like protein
MQRILPWGQTPEAYWASEAHREVRAETSCPRCAGGGPLHRHGTYARSITDTLGRVVRLLVARFRCAACRRTVSYLPEFALSYRLVQAATFEAYLDERYERPDVQRWTTLLAAYGRRVRRFAAELGRTIGCGLGQAPPATGRLWPWLKEACGGIGPATRRLVAEFKVTLFQSYQCHQPEAGWKTPRKGRNDGG